MLKRVDVAVYDAIEPFVDGTLEAGAVVFDLRQRTASATRPTGGHLDDVRTQLEELKQQIIDGEIKVPTEP